MFRARRKITFKVLMRRRIGKLAHFLLKMRCFADSPCLKPLNVILRRLLTAKSHLETKCSRPQSSQSSDQRPLPDVTAITAGSRPTARRDDGGGGHPPKVQNATTGLAPNFSLPTPRRSIFSYLIVLYDVIVFGIAIYFDALPLRGLKPNTWKIKNKKIKFFQNFLLTNTNRII